MGYRSKVIYAIVAPKETMISFLVAAKLSDPIIGSAIDEMRLMAWGNTHSIIAQDFSDVKWYEDYDDVKSHTAFWNYADENHEDLKIYGRFVRVGEESDDVEIKSFGDGDDIYDLADVSIDINTSIDFDAPEIRKTTDA